VRTTEGAALPGRPRDPLPTGARDVLPVEAGELRAAEDALRRAFRRYGYREVRTPVLEFAQAVDRAAAEGATAQAYRLFDPDGRVLVMRPDLTIPVARLIATRLTDHPGPLRVSYTGPAFRLPRPGRAEPSEHRQAGVELVGEAGPAADAEIVALLAEALAEAGLRGFRIGVGDVSLTAAVLRGLAVPEAEAARLRAAVGARDLVAWRAIAGALDLPEAERGLLAALPGMRGGAEVPARVAETVPAAGEACDRLVRTLELLAGAGVADRVLVDLGILRDWPYYSGLVVEAYAPGVGEPVAKGGRYDGLGGAFGAPRPAVGVAIELDGLHRALAAAEAVATGPVAGVVLVGGLDAERPAAEALRRRGLPVVALAGGDRRADEVARIEGWRFVAWRDGDAYRVRDRASGADVTCARLEEAIPSPS
jgi:ATP phosphoribosyltransferase regulatory subunit